MAIPRISTALRALTALVPAILFGQSGEVPVDTAEISAIIHAAASKNHRQIAKLIRYPLYLSYPVPPIHSSSECMKRFDEVFDDELLSDIARSNPERDWGRVGWRGIALGNGEVWLDEDYKIIAVNHETEAEKALKTYLIARQKRRLPSALRDFDEPVLEWTTPHFLIRVDKKGDDFHLIVFNGHSYTKPIHVLSHGDFHFDGSGGNYHIDWKAERRTYRVSVDGMSGEDSSYVEYDGPTGPLDLDDRTPALEEPGRDRIR